ncbi:MAG: dihydrodipicolinate synthase family protein [Anaerohalosphaeraceae bacterium]
MKNVQETANLLKGIIPPIVTPLRSQTEIDGDGLSRLVEHILAGGVHGLFVLGTTGEGPYLSSALRAELVRRVCRQVNRRVPIFVGITDTVVSESAALAHFAAENGADAVVAAPPYYLPMGQEELIGYMERLVSQVSLPVVLYNIPLCTKMSMDPQTVRRIAELPGVIGLKDSSGDMMHFQKIKWMFRENPGFKILMGTEELLAESLLLGADGGICGGANLFPRLYVDLYNAAVSSDIRKVRQLHQLVMKLSTAVYSVGQSSSGIFRGIKCALRIMGICSDMPAEPFCCFSESQQEKIREFLNEWRNLYPPADER